MSKEAKPTHYLVAITVLLAISLFSFTNVYSAPTETNQTSFWKTIYCNTIGDWFNSPRCLLREDIDIMEYNTVTLVDDEPNTQINNTDTNKTQSNPPSTSQLTVNRDSVTTLSSNPTNTQKPIFDLSILNNYVTKDYLSSNNSKTNPSDYVTRDFLSRQVGAIGDSFGRSLSDTSARLTALIPSSASISNWDSFFTTPSTRILAGTNLSWDGNTLNATGGSSSGVSLALSDNVFGQSSLAPTTTQNLAISGIGTSTFAGGLESWRQISSPYFQATSTTATSTFAGGLSVTGNVDIQGTVTLSGDTYLNTSGGRQYLQDFDRYIGSTTRVTNIAYIGDSWTVGQGYTAPITTYLQDRYGFGGIGYVGAQTFMPQPSGSTRSTTGTWTEGMPGSSEKYGVSLSYSKSTDTATPATKVFSGAATSFVIHYVVQSGGGTFSYAVDGAGATTIDTASGGTAMASTTVSGLSSTVPHILTLTVTGAGTNGVVITGVDFQYGTSGVRTHNIAFTGTTVSNWLAQDSTLWQSSLAGLSPNVVTILLGVNDAAQGVTPETYASNLTSLVGRVRTALPYVSIVILSPSDIGLATTYPMISYVDKMRSAATQNRLAFLDNYKLIGNYTDANSRGLYANTTHVSTEGYSLLANHFIQFIAQTYSLKSNSLVSNKGTSMQVGGTISLNNIGTGNTGVGNSSLYYNTIGSYNTAQGQSSLVMNTTGSYNTAQGFEALGYNISATNTTALGYYAARGSSLYSSQGGTYLGYKAGFGAGTGGDYNTMLGYEAGYSTSIGDNALYAGYRAGYYATSSLYSTYLGYEAGRGVSGTHQMGDYNTAVGYKALNVNTTGVNNLAIGTNALGSNTAGSNNSAQGMYSLYSNTTGSYNSAQGYASLYSNTTGNDNSAQGAYSLYLNTTGSNNSAHGTNALRSNTTGSYNSAQGYASLYSNTTGSNNVGQGYYALRYNQSATNTTAVGYQAGRGTANYSNQGGVYLGYQAGYSAGTGSDYNTLLGYQAGYNITTGSDNIIIGQNVNATSSNSMGGLNIGNVLFGTGMYTGGSVSATAIATGRIGVATTSPWRTLAVTGTVGFDGLTGATGAGSICLSATKELVYNAGSDACLPSLRSTKHDISNLSTSSLSTLNLLTPVSFIYNQGDNRTRYGFIAEDVSQIDTHLATYNDKGEISGIDDRALIALAVGSIKELDIKIRNIITSVGEWVFNKITATLGVFERIETKTASISDGIQMTDKTTGQIYCLNINNGNLDKSIGPCSTATTTTIISPTPTPEPSPTVMPDPTPAPSTTPLPDSLTPSPDPTITPIPEPSPTPDPTPIPSPTPVPDLPTSTPVPEPAPTIEPAETVSREQVSNPVTEPVSQPVSEPTSSETTE